MSNIYIKIYHDFLTHCILHTTDNQTPEKFNRNRITNHISPHQGLVIETLDAIDLSVMGSVWTLDRQNGRFFPNPWL